jgi:hypothetical protein
MKFSYRSYLPIIYVYILTLFLASLVSRFFNFNLFTDQVSIFLGIFSLVFSIFKLYRLENYVEALAEYDFLTQKFKPYGYAFPFFEFTFGVMFLFRVENLSTEITCLFLFTLNLISVLNALTKKRKFVCACLGDLIKVPLSYVSLIENLTMILGVIYLILN